MKKRLICTAMALMVSLGMFTAGLTSSAAALVYPEDPSVLSREEMRFVALAPGSDTTEVYLTWYAPANTTDARVHFSGMADVSATLSQAEANNGDTFTSCKAAVSGLTPGQSYKYQISDDGGATWSSAYDYNCPAAGSFTFAFVGDPQLGNDDTQKDTGNWFAENKSVTAAWGKVLEKIDASGASFIASGGDQLEAEGEDVFDRLLNWDVLKSLPFAQIVGNHDRSPQFDNHYFYPNAQSFESKGNSSVYENNGNYYYLYNNALFVVLNTAGEPSSSSNGTKRGKAFIENFRTTLEAATTEFDGQYDWLFVQHHRSTKSIADHWYMNSEATYYFIQYGFERLMDEYDVDVVLSGHDHSYTRTKPLVAGVPVSDSSDSITDTDGVIYVTGNSSSGGEYYDLTTGLASSWYDVFDVMSQNKKPGYSIINVTENTVTFNTYELTGDSENPGTDVVDSFTITKSNVNHRHSMTHTAAVSATCTSDGNSEYWYCSGCGKYFSNESGDAEISASDTVISKAGHSFSNYVYNNDATYSSDGTKTAICEICGATDTQTAAGTRLSDADAPIISGIDNNAVYCCKTAVSFTVSDKALNTVTLDKKVLVPDKNGVYTVNAKNGVQTICATDKSGNTAVKSIIVSADHVWDNGKITAAPTYDNDGIRTYTCKGCGTEKTEPLAKLVPEITSGAKSEWKAGSNYGLSFTVSVSSSAITGVSVDGDEADNNNYSLTEYRVTLLPDFLAKLSAGKHTLSISFSENSATAEFTVSAAQSVGGAPAKTQPTDASDDKKTEADTGSLTSPQTGDSSLSILSLLLVASAAAAAVIAVAIKKRTGEDAR